ncbi:MAG: PAS domain-containing protein [Magnetococcales bacterium]|nr:PAS domain-containing protein [Magnetococcales bacterium]
MKIRTRAILLATPVILSLLAGAILFQYVVFGYALEKKIHSHLRSVASIQQKHLDNILEWTIERTHLVASQSSLRTALSRYLTREEDQLRLEMRSNLLEMLHAIPGFRKISLLNLSGVVIVSSDPGEKSIHHFQESYFAKAREGVTFGDPFLDESGELAARLGAPLFLDSRILGIILIEFRMRRLLSVLQDDTGFGRDSDAMLVRKQANGDLLRITPPRSALPSSVARPSPDNGLDQILRPPLPKGHYDVEEGMDDQGRPLLVIMRPLERFGWNLVVKINAEEAYAPVRQAWSNTLAILAGMGLVALIGVVFLMQRLVRPLEEVSRAVQQVGTGEHGQQPVPCDRSDELGDLVATFNEFTGRLNDANRRLHEKNRLFERHQVERERLERIQLELNAFLDNIFSSNHLLIARLDSRGNFVRVNHLYAEAGGHPPEYYIGRNYFDLFPNPTLLSHFRRALSSGKPWVAFDYPFQFPDTVKQSGLYWDCSLTPLNVPRGETNGLILQMVDVTKRKESVTALKESERRYWGVFDNAPIPYWEEDLSRVRNLLEDLTNKGVEDLGSYLHTHPDVLEECVRQVRITNVNRASLTLYGAGDKEQFYRILPKIMTPESTRTFIDGLVALADGESTYSCESRHRTLHGKTLRTMVHVSLAPGHEVGWSRVLVCILDLTLPGDPEGT